MTIYHVIILRTLSVQEILIRKTMMIESFSFIELFAQIEKQEKKRSINEQFSTSLFKRLFARQTLLVKNSTLALVIKFIIVKVVIIKISFRKYRIV